MLPLPLEIGAINSGFCDIIGARGEAVAVNPFGSGACEEEAAVEIVRICNTHEALLAACREADKRLRFNLIYMSPWGASLETQLTAAIARAEPT